MATKISLLPSVLDLALYAGDGVVLLVTFTNSQQQPLIVDGDVIGQIRPSRTDPDTPVEFAVDLSDGANGNVTISLTGAQTASLVTQDGKQWSGVWDLQWTPQGEEPVTVLQGAITCDVDVTRNGA